MIWLLSTPSYDKKKRVGLLMASAFFQGASIGPLVDVVIIQVDPGPILAAKGLYGKPFIHFDALVEIFAKDRANGKGATLSVDELEEIELEAIGESMSVNASNPTPNSEETSKCKARKKACHAPLDVGVASGIHLMATSFSKFVDGAMLHFKSIQECMTQENEVNIQLFKELGKIEA